MTGEARHEVTSDRRMVTGRERAGYVAIGLIAVLCGWQFVSNCMGFIISSSRHLGADWLGDWGHFWFAVSPWTLPASILLCIVAGFISRRARIVALVAGVALLVSPAVMVLIGMLD